MMTREQENVTPQVRDQDVVAFGAFRLIVGERALRKDGVEVQLGARTLDTLIALVSRPNEVLSKRDLLARVWPDVLVEEGSLRVQIANLRRALGDGEDGARYITTIAGRGYCFVAPITRSVVEAPPPERPRHFTRLSLPNPLTRMVGRADDVRLLSDELLARRFVTIVGSGGVGKTSLALAVAHGLSETFSDAVVFVDLGAVSRPDLVAPTIAAVLGLSVQSADPRPGLIAYLKQRRALLILDTCEHLIEAVAELAARLFLEVPSVHILATSREALRVGGEHLYKLDALPCPPEVPQLTAAAAQTYPAAQLFVERAIASGARLELTDADAAVVAGICRKLDGVPLAIELAAARVDVYGLNRTAALLDQRLSRFWQGQRTAPPRQKTLQATLEWSHGLMSQSERAVLRRLAIFIGPFTIEQAIAIVASATFDDSLVIGVIDGLVRKSMVAATPFGAMMRYRLLDTTRGYALETPIAECELRELSLRHATYYLNWLEESPADSATSPRDADRTADPAGLANVRAALEWCLGVRGDEELGLRLAATAAPFLFRASLFNECCRWCERALGALSSAARGTLQETALQINLGMSLMVTRGSSQEARAALDRGLAIAEACGDNLNQLAVLQWLHRFHVRAGDCSTALHYATLSTGIAERIDDPAAIALAHYLSGYSLQLSGNIDDSRVELEAALAHVATRKPGVAYLGLDDGILVATALSRTLWLQGYPVQAVVLGQQAVRDAEGAGRPLTESLSVISLVTLLLWTGDLQSVAHHIDRFTARAQSYSLGPYRAVGRGLKGQLAVQLGNGPLAAEYLQESLEELHAARYEVMTTLFNIALVQAWTACNRIDPAMRLAQDTIRLIHTNGDFGYMPEALRAKAGVLLAAGLRNDAKGCLMQSIDVSRRMKIRAWELRAAIDLAEFLAGEANPHDAKTLLQTILEQFTEGYETADLQRARQFLQTTSDLAGAPSL